MTKWRVVVWPLAIFCFGYVALLLFWSFGDRPAGLPGLFVFRSATWGDGLLLPLLALCLRVLTLRLRAAGSTAVSRRGTVAVVALAGAVLGGAVVLSWFLDDHPGLNWTNPRPHYFNAAGKYHATFLVLACAVFAGLGADLVVHLRRAGTAAVRKALTSSWACVALACMAGYGYLGVLDGTRGEATAGSTVSLAVMGIAGVVVIAAVFLLQGGAGPAYVNTLVVALILTVFTVVFALAHPHMSALTYAALVSAVLSGLGLTATTESGSHVSAVEALGVCGLFGTTTVYVSTAHSDRLWMAVAAAFPATAGAVALRWLRANVTHMPRQSPVTWEYGMAAGISTCLLLSSMFAAWISERAGDEYITGGFILTVVGAVLGGVFFQYFKSDFTKLMQLEGDPTGRSAGQQASPAQSQAARRVWIRLASYSLAAFSGMLVLSISLAPSLGWRPGGVGLRWTLVFSSVGTAVLVAALIAKALATAARPHQDWARREAPARTDTPAWVCAVGGAVMSVVVGTGVAQEGVFNGLAAVQAVMIALFATEGILGNGLWLHVGKPTPASRSAVAAAALAVGVTTYWSLTGLIRPGGRGAHLGQSLSAWLCCAVLVFVLVVSTTSAVYVAGGRAYWTDYPPANNVMQDAFLLAVLWLTLGWLPQTVLTHIPASATERWAAVGTLLAGFMLTFCPPFLWTLENNDTHVCRQRLRRQAGEPPWPTFSDSSFTRITHLGERVSGLSASVTSHEHEEDGPEPDADVFLVRLSGHTAAQNSIALLLALVSLIGAVGMTAGFTGDSEQG
ncbi:hypothetical protein ACIQI8_28785 [Streptomyces sp. NPDC092369]|uniref:hypothetical protein n=1 Tax=Streptomyces sp. NPDC092369 TaxID=3366015 RepID=UPI003825B2EA